MDRREEAVQQVEEARLALRAAQRDNAELQTRLQQAAMQSRPGHSHSRPATAGRMWAAPRDRAYASATALPNSKYVCVNVKSSANSMPFNLMQLRTALLNSK